MKEWLKIIGTVLITIFVVLAAIVIIAGFKFHLHAGANFGLSIDFPQDEPSTSDLIEWRESQL